jgi:hypothetical protein
MDHWLGTFVTNEVQGFNTVMPFITQIPMLLDAIREGLRAKQIRQGAILCCRVPR